MKGYLDEPLCSGAHEDSITALVFSPDGRILLSGAADGTLRLWNIPFICGELSALGLDW
ncbi:MAG: WD40 repeat domain-containing protein [Pirellulaceae bacterium]